MADNYKAGTYVLLNDRFSTTDGREYQKGDEIKVDSDAEATRLGRAGAIAQKNDVRAQQARGELPENIVNFDLSREQLVQQRDAITARIEEIDRAEEQEHEANEAARTGTTHPSQPAPSGEGETPETTQSEETEADGPARQGQKKPGGKGQQGSS